MTSRRTFLAAAGVLTTAIAKPRPSPVMGLEIYSLRREAEKDLPATLALIRKFGFKEVEGGDFYGRRASIVAGAVAVPPNSESCWTPTA